MDHLEGPLPEEAAQIQIVDKMKHLGINITKNPKHYITDNIVPLLAKFTGKIKIWKWLPLSVAGRRNQIKMLWMLQLLYVDEKYSAHIIQYR